MSKNENKTPLGDEIDPRLWRRFHKITPFASLGAFWAAIGAFCYSVIKNIAENEQARFFDVLRYFGNGFVLACVVLAFCVFSILIIAAAYFSWRNKTYALTDSGVHLRQGIIRKKHRQIPWERIHTVDVQQKFLGRIFGFGSVKISSASNEEDIELGLLRLAECGKVRAEVLKAADAVRMGRPYIPPDTDLPRDGSAGENSLAETPVFPEIPILDADDAENDLQIYELPFFRQLFTDLCSRLPAVVVLLCVAGAGISASKSYITLFVICLTIVAGLLRSMFKDFGTRIYISDHGLRRRYGLTMVRTRTIPPQRIHAVELVQPFMWRRFDWWTVNVLVAGGSTDSDKDDLSSMGFVPAGTLPEVLGLLWTVIPDLGVDDAGELLREALAGSGSGKYVTGAPARGRILDPVTGPGRGIFASEKVLLIRSGRWRRRVTFILQDHLQATGMSVGPLQGRLGLASFRVHLVNGIVKSRCKNYTRDFVENFLRAENLTAARARKKGVSESLDGWKRRVLFGSAAQNTGKIKREKTVGTAGE